MKTKKITVFLLIGRVYLENTMPHLDGSGQLTAFVKKVQNFGNLQTLLA